MFAANARRGALRLYSTSKPPLTLVAELRKRTEVSITKAREALSATSNDVNAALDWLEKDLVISGAKKAAKVEDRVAGEGVVSVSILSGGGGRATPQGGVRGAMIELNCETDFVGRNALFANLAADIAHTAAFISEKSPESSSLIRPFPMELLQDAPLVPRDPLRGPAAANTTVSTSIRDMIAKVGEKISLRRAVTVVQDPLTQSDLNLRLASYLHGSVDLPSQGRIGALAVLALKSPHLSRLLASEEFRVELERLERSLARQIVGFDTQRVRATTGDADEMALYEQPFAMLAGELSGQPVATVLKTWAVQRGMLPEEDAQGGVEVLEFAKWAVGSHIQA